MNTGRAATIHGRTIHGENTSGAPLSILRLRPRDGRHIVSVLSRLLRRVLLAVRERYDLRRDRFRLLLEFLGMLDQAARGALIADRFRETPCCRGALAKSGHALRKLVE
jgi:hypothetical protein